MVKVFLCRNTTLGDTFETNYGATEGGTIIHIREMTIASASEVETNLVFQNSTTKKWIYHVEIDKINWSDDRVGAADWISRMRTGAVGDATVDFVDCDIKRVSADGNTIRATIAVFSTGTRSLNADTNFDDTTSADTSLDNPGGAAIDDHLVIVFTGTETNGHGGDDTTSVEQNTAAGARLSAPIDDDVPPPADVQVSFTPLYDLLGGT